MTTTAGDVSSLPKPSAAGSNPAGGTLTCDDVSHGRPIAKTGRQSQMFAAMTMLLPPERQQLDPFGMQPVHEGARPPAGPSDRPERDLEAPDRLSCGDRGVDDERS